MIGENPEGNECEEPVGGRLEQKDRLITGLRTTSKDVRTRSCDDETLYLKLM